MTHDQFIECVFMIAFLILTTASVAVLIKCCCGILDKIDEKEKEKLAMPVRRYTSGEEIINFASTPIEVDGTVSSD